MHYFIACYSFVALEDNYEISSKTLQSYMQLQYCILIVNLLIINDNLSGMADALIFKKIAHIGGSYEKDIGFL